MEVKEQSLEPRPSGPGGRGSGLSLTAALPSSGKVGPVGDHGLGDRPVLGPVA